MVASLDQAFGSMDPSSSSSSPGRSDNFQSTNKRSTPIRNLSADEPLAKKHEKSHSSSDMDSHTDEKNRMVDRLNVMTYPITTEERLQNLSQELQKQREYMEYNRTGYVDKLMSKRRDILKLIMFALVIVLALSCHTVIKHYFKSFFESSVLTPTKEFFIRIAYPFVIFVALWNTRAFVRT